MNQKELKQRRSKTWCNGGKYKDQFGYVQVYCPDHPHSQRGMVPEHRLNMEGSLGRILNPKEVVHHINEIRDDNKIKNLQLFESKGKHAHFHAIKSGRKSIRPNDYKYTKEHRENISNGLRGKVSQRKGQKLPKDHSKNISNGIKEWWRKRKEMGI